MATEIIKKRIYELTNKISNFTGWLFAIDKNGEDEAVKVDFDVLNTVFIHNNFSGLNDGDYIHLTANEKTILNKTSDLHAIAFAATTLNTTDSVNALWVTQGTSFRLPYDCEVESINLILKTIDTGTVGTFNMQIKGAAGNVFNSNISLGTAAASDGSVGITSTDVNASYKTGVQGTELIFKIVAGTNADAGDMMVFIKLKRV